ncbi:hypothetical protein [Flavobacterium soli]|uniref:hypothetical protein n=1 Tax=Flavobacterium soli TaxID=344881 RepID=UPI0004161B9F|nr:hypothetical protein [Flavobacterium soli]
MDNKNKEHGDSWTILEIIFLCFIIIAIKYFDENLPHLSFEICFFAVFGVMIWRMYLILEKKFTNIKLPFFLFTSIILIFPFLHFVFYKIDSKNYTFSQEFLDLKQKEFEASAIDYKDCAFLLSFVNDANNLLLKSKIDDTLIGKTFSSGQYIIRVEATKNLRRPCGRDYNCKDVYVSNKKSLERAKFTISSETVKEAITKKINKRDEIVSMSNDLKSNVHFNSLYFDSVSVFIFSNFKPITGASQFLQFLQLITFFFFLHSVTVNLDRFDKFIVVKRQDS